VSRGNFTTHLHSSRLIEFSALVQSCIWYCHACSSFVGKYPSTLIHRQIRSSWSISSVSSRVLLLPMRRANNMEVFSSWPCSPLSHQKRSQTLKSKKHYIQGITYLRREFTFVSLLGNSNHTGPRRSQRKHDRRCFRSSTFHTQ
jgi:hypothetical protein